MGLSSQECLLFSAFIHSILLKNTDSVGLQKTFKDNLISPPLPITPRHSVPHIMDSPWIRPPHPKNPGSTPVFEFDLINANNKYLPYIYI